MINQWDLRYLILGMFLISHPTLIFLSLQGPSLFAAGMGFYVLLAGFFFYLMAVLVGFLDLRRMQATKANQFLWTLYFLTFGFLAFPVYLFKRFTREKLPTPS